MDKRRETESRETGAGLALCLLPYRLISDEYCAPQTSPKNRCQQAESWISMNKIQSFLAAWKWARSKV
jgi:hypothetical protein